jgi:hypothetical protein
MTEHALDGLVVIAGCTCGRAIIRDTEAAALAAMDAHCEDPAATPAPPLRVVGGDDQ